MYFKKLKFIYVRMKGLEPIRPKHYHLKVACLPIPTRAQVVQPGLEPGVFWTKTKRVAITLLDNKYLKLKFCFVFFLFFTPCDYPTYRNNGIYKKQNCFSIVSV